MRVTRLLDNSVGAATSETLATKMILNEDGVFQAQIHTGTATIKLQGRVAPTAPWADLTLNSAGATSATASGVFFVPLLPEMRVTVTGTGTVSAWVGD